MAEAGVIELLQELVALPSVNPVHCPDPKVANERRMAEYVGRYLERLGFRLAWDEMSAERCSVIGVYGPDQPRHTLLLEAHLDTVDVSEMRIPPFTGEIREGRMYGRGTCDTKGPMAAALQALQPARLEALAAAGVRLIFAGALGEEHGNLGAVRLAEQGLGADAAIILEPTELAIVHAHKGVMWFEVELEGETGHGSDPAKGRNAIVAMTRFMRWLEETLPSGAPPDGTAPLGPPTLNFGRIEGGAAINIIAGRCRLEVDRRLVPGEDPEKLIGTIRDYLDGLQSEGAIRAYRLRPAKVGLPFLTPRDAGLVAGLGAAIRGEGREPSVVTASWYSDAGAFSQTCREVVVFGPGSIAQAHTSAEFIELDELLAAQRILERYLTSLAQAMKGHDAGTGIS